MKFAVLMSVGHNLADSLASGMGLLVGVYATDIFGEAAVSPRGSITIDFLRGVASAGVVSPSLAGAVKLYGDAVDAFCAKHGAQRSDFAVMNATYGTHPVHGPHIRVAVEDARGRRGVQDYYGLPARSLPTARR